MGGTLDRLGLVGNDYDPAVPVDLDSDRLSTGRKGAFERLGYVAVLEGLAGSAHGRPLGRSREPQASATMMAAAMARIMAATDMGRAHERKREVAACVAQHFFYCRQRTLEATI
jgi:hypothetical protein